MSQSYCNSVLTATIKAGCDAFLLYLLLNIFFFFLLDTTVVWVLHYWLGKDFTHDPVDPNTTLSIYPGLWPELQITDRWNVMARPLKRLEKTRALGGNPWRPAENHGGATVQVVDTSVVPTLTKNKLLVGETTGIYKSEVKKQFKI